MGLSFSDVIDLWTQSGGSPQAAAMAAAVADASSGLNPDASNTAKDGTTVNRGLWQIPSTLAALSTTDPSANARAAIQLSNNGTDFSQWCSTWSDNACGANGGTYLGEGSNALAALQQRGGHYAVIGGIGTTTATPEFPTGTDATGQAVDSSGNAVQTSSDATPPTTNTGSSRMIVILVLVALGAITYWLMKHKPKGSAPAPTVPEG